MKVERTAPDAYTVSGWHLERLHERRFWVFDLEATGGNSATERVTQFGAVRVEGGRRVPGSEFMQLVQPGVPIRPFIAELTGVTASRVQAAPPFAGAFAEFTRRGEGCVWVTQAGFGFDIPLLLAECARHGVPFPVRPLLDTRALHTHLYPDDDTLFNMSFLLRHFSIPLGGRRRHDALGDASLTADVLCAQLAVCRARGIDDLHVPGPLKVREDDLPEGLPTLTWSLESRT